MAAPDGPAAEAGEETPRGLRRWWEGTSLAFRLFLLATGWSLLALAAAAIVLLAWYRSTVERGFETLLDVYSLNLVASIEQGDDGRLTGTPNLGEPRFSSFQSGWYWQARVMDEEGLGLASASLAGERTEMPPTSEVPYGRDFRRSAIIEGPDGKQLMAVERIVVFDRSGDWVSFLITGNLADVDAEIAAFRTRLLIVFAVLGAGLVTISVAQVLVGLLPLRRLRRALADIREGREGYLRGVYPGEITPLVRELNSLITSNEKVVERARTHVGNLAHALKTPLSVLLNEARAAKGPLSEKVIDQAQTMQHQLDLYLERARMAGRSRVLGAVCEVDPVVQSLARVMNRVHEERGIEVRATSPDGLRFRGERQDLEEMLGNLIDNACKWAAAEVVVTAQRRDAETIEILIEDDGPGLPAGQRQEALKRGKRLDTSRPGSGLGLSIVVELADLYEGHLLLEDAPTGGLRARLVLPGQ